jgi:hypothetical protein
LGLTRDRADRARAVPRGVDCVGAPAGVSGFEEIVRDAVELDLDGLTVSVASIDDLIRMKRAAGRPKDLIEVEVLAAVRDEVRRQNG